MSLRLPIKVNTVLKSTFFFPKKVLLAGVRFIRNKEPLLPAPLERCGADKWIVIGAAEKIGRGWQMKGKKTTKLTTTTTRKMTTKMSPCPKGRNIHSLLFVNHIYL